MNFSDFNLHLDTSYNTFEVGPNQEVQVLKYLPIADKNDLIQITLQNSEENGLYNLLLVDMYFNLYIVYIYTNIEFTDEEKEDAPTLYDILWSSGVIDAVLNTMDEREYKTLYQMLSETLENKMKYKSTIASVINSFIEQLPVNAENAAEIIKNFNPEQFQQVLSFARAANGNRPIEG